MKRLSRVAVGIFALCLWGRPVCAQKALSSKQLEDRMERTYKAIRTFSQSSHGQIQLKGPGVLVMVEIRTTVQIIRPDRFRIESSMIFNGEEQRETVISDGKTVWDYDPDAKEYTEQPVTDVLKDPDEFADWIGEHGGGDVAPVLILNADKKSKRHDEPYKLKSVHRRTVDGRPTYVVKMGVGGKSENTDEFTLYIDSADLLLRRLRVNLPLPKEAREVGASAELVFFYTKVKSNAPLSDDAFKFTPPADAKKMDKIESIMKRAFPQGLDKRT